MILTELAMECNLRTKHNASLTFCDVEAAGPAVPPLDFPVPRIGRADRVKRLVKDSRTGRIDEIPNIIVRVPQKGQPNNKPSDEAYAIRRKVAKSTYGAVYACNVLKRRTSESAESANDRSDAPCCWETSTEEYVALKISSFQRMRELRGKNLEDPFKEAAALQYVGNYHPNVLGCLEVLRDDEWLYTVLPFCPGGDLYSCFTKKQSTHVPEQQVRVWFRQLTQALFHLQNKGIAHRDVSLENIMLDKNNNLTLVDFGLALRVPYTDINNFGSICDVSEGFGMYRRLVRAQGQVGHASFRAPEVLHGEQPFDGFAVDLWSAAVILFIALVGRAPFRMAHATDTRYVQISNGGLRDLLRRLNIPLSENACHLLQNMMWADPKKRYTLSQVMSHPWVTGEKPAFTYRPSTPLSFSSRDTSTPSPTERSMTESPDVHFRARTPSPPPTKIQPSKVHSPPKKLVMESFIESRNEDELKEVKQNPPAKASLKSKEFQIQYRQDAKPYQQATKTPANLNKLLKAGRFQFNLKNTRIFSHPSKDSEGTT